MNWSDQDTVIKARVKLRVGPSDSTVQLLLLLLLQLLLFPLV
jgi:hypothetical protein